MNNEMQSFEDADTCFDSELAAEPPAALTIVSRSVLARSVADGSPQTSMLKLLGQLEFLGPLSRIYRTDLDAFDRIAVLRQVGGFRQFLFDADYRRTLLEYVCRRTLPPRGLLAVRPARGTFKLREEGEKARAPRWNEELALCHLFGAAGFAQLCDDRLDRPIPLFLQPWSRDGGFLRPRILPPTSFSQALCAQRLGDGRMILFDKGANAALTA